MTEKKMHGYPFARVTEYCASLNAVSNQVTQGAEPSLFGNTLVNK